MTGQTHSPIASTFTKVEGERLLGSQCWRSLSGSLMGHQGAWLETVSLIVHTYGKYPPPTLYLVVINVMGILGKDLKDFTLDVTNCSTCMSLLNSRLRQWLTFHPVFQTSTAVRITRRRLNLCFWSVQTQLLLVRTLSGVTMKYLVSPLIVVR